MHHHHPMSATPTITTPSTSIAAAGGAPPHQRRRKKRPNYGTRTVEVRRGYNGFGFTISGQQPCRLSCIVSNSPADQAGLRAGDFLISVNGLNVSKLPHETVVQLIGNSFGSIRMQIAENYYSDSSDEENAVMLQQQQMGVSATSGGQLGATVGASVAVVAGVGGVRAKPRYMHHKTKIHRLRNSPQKKRTLHTQLQRPETCTFTLETKCASPALKPKILRPLMEDLPLPLLAIAQNGSSVAASSPPSIATKATPAASTATTASTSNVANVSAMVRVRVPTAALEYRAIVGYLGTIEMPKQISHSSKLQTVRSCIRKLRQEKRQPTTVLMTILPDCLRLQATNGSLLAEYASARLNYVSSSSESENRFFGLVTSAVHTSQADDDDDEEHEVLGIEMANRQNAATACGTGHISISNSCHVFAVDTKLCDHQAHLPRAADFHINCTRDCISNLCLEFPNNSEYVVNLIRSMYTMRILPPATRNANADEFQFHGVQGVVAGPAAAHSPQPSNHSEISTTTSNSDSGIGFHNDCTNIADRILVVDFPGAAEMRMRPSVGRPMGICNNFDAILAATEKRLTVRVMPNPKTPPHISLARPNLLNSFNLIKSPATSLTATRSCDDVLALLERAPTDGKQQAQASLMGHASMDDISLHSATTTTADLEAHTFLRPAICNASSSSNSRKSVNANSTCLDTYTLLQSNRSGVRCSLQPPSTTAVPKKLSPQVFDHSTNGETPMPAQTTARLSSCFPAINVATPSGCFAAKDVPADVTTSTEWCTWSSLQNLRATANDDDPYASQPQARNFLEVTFSEPDLGVRLHNNVTYNSIKMQIHF